MSSCHLRVAVHHPVHVIDSLSRAPHEAEPLKGSLRSCDEDAHPSPVGDRRRRRASGPWRGAPVATLFICGHASILTRSCSRRLPAQGGTFAIRFLRRIDAESITCRFLLRYATAFCVSHRVQNMYRTRIMDSRHDDDALMVTARQRATGVRCSKKCCRYFHGLVS